MQQKYRDKKNRDNVKVARKRRSPSVAILRARENLSWHANPWKYVYFNILKQERVIFYHYLFFGFKLQNNLKTS